jgi:hypothetical protein
MPLKFPPPDWKSTGWTPSEAATSIVDLETSKMLKTSTFYGLWSCYVIGTLSGLMAIGISSSVGQEGDRYLAGLLIDLLQDAQR